MDVQISFAKQRYTSLQKVEWEDTNRLHFDPTPKKIMQQFL